MTICIIVEKGDRVRDDSQSVAHYTDFYIKFD